MEQLQGSRRVSDTEADVAELVRAQAFDGDHDRDLVAAAARLAMAAAADGGLVELHHPRQKLSVRADHSAPQLLQPGPGVS